MQQSYAASKERSIQMLGAEFSEVLKYADASMWEQANKKVDLMNSSVAFDLLQWLKLRAGVQEFSQYESFLLVNNDWPGISLLRAQGEKTINSFIKPTRILNYFQDNKPLTANGALQLAKVLLTKNEIERANSVIEESWLDHSYSAAQLEEAINLFDEHLNQHHVERIDNLLWSDRLDQVELMLSLVPKDVALLSKARIALKKQRSGVDLLISNLPKHLITDPGLIFDRFSFRRKRKLHDGAEQLLLENSNTATTLGRPEAWIKGRSAYARRALLNGEPKKAYAIVSNHFINFSSLTGGNEAAELEWLAGFIAFEFFKDYEMALWHFDRFFENVVNPINVAKASYWIGRSYEKLSKFDKMRKSFAIGAKYQTTFYGQLSAERGNFPVDLNIVSSDIRHRWEDSKFVNYATVKSAILLYYSGRSVLADRFFNHSSESMRKSDRLKLSQLANDLGLSASGLSIAKTAGQVGMFCPDFLFPLMEKNIAIDRNLIPLVTSIIRQESGFFTSTKSSAGAIGLMQVMPRTAISMAKKLGVGFTEEKLMWDENYNIKIGTHFLKTMLKKFEGSKVLSIAAYNAGPYRVKEWINQFGDPRAKGIDPLVWIELIPFVETRNYVKRVMEADWVYRGKVNGIPLKLNLARQSFGHRF